MTQDLTNTSQNIMDSDLIAHRVQAVAAAHKDYTDKKDALTDSILDWLKSRVTQGMIVDLSYDNHRAGNVPEYMSNDKVMRGNARGAKKFRIEAVTDVTVGMPHFDNTRWQCTATPISESTGKLMSGRVAKSMSYGSDCDRTFVTLQFNLFRLKF